MPILRLVLRRATILAGCGIVVGAWLGAYASRWLEGLLFEVAARDWSVFLTVAIIMFLVSLAAAVLPAWRAATMDPMWTLRQQ